MKKLKTILKYKYIILIFILILSLIRINIKKTPIIKTNIIKGTVISYKKEDNYTSFIIKNKYKIKCIYYNKLNINYGDILYIKGTLTMPDNNTIPNTYNNKKYLNNNNIYYILEVNNIIKHKTTNNILYKIKNTIQNRINKIDNKGYLNALILGNKNNIKDNIYNSYIKNGIVHIFCISGMHISLLSLILLKILNKIKKNKTNYIIIIIFLLYYMFLTNYLPSITKTIIFYIILFITKITNKSIPTLNILLYSIIILLIINPSYLYNTGFQYSSIISYTIIYLKESIPTNYIKSLIKISIISLIISLPITINLNYEINLLSIIINIIFIPLITYILYPLTLLVVIIPKLNIILNIIINIIETLSILISKINLFIIHIPHLNIYNIIIYYLIILLIKNNKLKILLLIIYIIFIKLYYITDNKLYINYIDIGQGDLELIKYKNKTIMIDTGPNNEYKINNVKKYLYSIGINKINYLIITHGDSDHIGNANNLLNNFKVNNVIFNCGEYNELEQNLIKILKKKNINYYSCIDEVKISNYKLKFLNTIIYNNENDNSSVIYLNYYNYKFLFMGDASIEREKDILKKYNLINIDFLKVGHHGSNTSSSNDFISSINPKYSIISVGKNNIYKHPKTSVLNILKENNSKIYRTDIDGSIEIKIKSDGYSIETCKP